MSIESRISALPAHLREKLKERLAGRSDRAAAIPAAPRTGSLPMSSAQRRLWFLNQLQPDSADYNSALALRLRGPLDLDALRRAVRELPRRHESLRTVFG